MKLKLLLIAALLITFKLDNRAQQDTSLEVSTYKKPKIGLVLSGGGAKGLAHVGVLKVIEECGIKPDYITGTSMGSVVGGLYAIGYSAVEIEDFINKIDWNTLLTDKITWQDIGIFKKETYPGYPLKFVFKKGKKPSLPSGMIEGQKIHALLLQLTWESNNYNSFDEFPIPFRCVATDIMTGTPIIFKNGSLADAMRASMSIPTVFSPVIKDTILLADGGMVRNFPVQECIDMGADIIIGSYTGFNEKAKAEDINSIVSILARTSAFQGINDAKIQIPKTDILIVPDLKAYGPENFAKAKKIIQAGELAARDSITYLKLKELSNYAELNVSENINLNPQHNIQIDQIIISGAPSSDIKFIEKLCNIYPGNQVNKNILSKAIQKLYATGNYAKISYQIINEIDKTTLIFDCTEVTPGKLEFGLHYNNSFGAAIFARYAMEDFIIKSSLFRTKIAFSENPRVQLNYDYYPTKKKNISIFIESYAQASKMPRVFRGTDTIVELGHYKYRRFNYSLGGKLRLWRNAMIKAHVGQSFNTIRMKNGIDYLLELDKVDYTDFFAKVQFKINNLDDPFFPTKGIFLNLSYKWLYNASISKPYEPIYGTGLSSYNEIIHFNYKQYISILNRVSIIPEINFGIMAEKSFFSEEFYIGGINYNLHPNSVNMSGINANNIVADQYVMMGLALQLKLSDKWYLVNGAQLLGFIDHSEEYSLEDDDIIVGETLDSWYAGVGVSSMIGPIRLICSGNSSNSRLFWSLNIGVPF